MKKLSVALTVHNEQENIRKCLDSVLDLASEVVVVDGESTDNTPDILKEMGARVIVKPNQKNFHINKQIAIDNCKFDWILQLDADELVSQQLKSEIKKILKDDTLLGEKSASSIPNGFWIPRKNWFLGRFLMKGGQYPDYTLRLYRNGKGRLPQKDVHEQAVVEGDVGYAEEALLHYPYKNFNAYLNKWNRYNHFEAGLLKERLLKKPFMYTILTFVDYLIFKPIWWFLWTYGRHKGFMDLWPGFVFSLFSALRYPMVYLIFLKNKI